MSETSDAERKLVGTCIAWDCEQPVHPPAVFCATHAQPAQPGIVEPHLEVRARQAGEAEMRRIREEQPLVLDIGEVPDPWSQLTPEHRAIINAAPITPTHKPADPAKDAAKLVKKALKGKRGHAMQQLAWALVGTIEQTKPEPPHPR